MLDKDKVKKLYLEGNNYYIIAIKLKANPETVRKCIYRNLKEFRMSYEAEKIRRKEVDRITRFESNQCMSDRSFILKNRSIYKTNLQGDILLNKKVAPVITFDTPRQLKNENSLSEINKRIINSEYKKDELFC